MKNLLLLLVVILMAVVFTSCQKEEIVNQVEEQPVVSSQKIDIEAIMSQLASFSDLTVKIVSDSMKAKSQLKDAQILTHNRVKTVRPRNYYVQDNQAIKPYDYLKTDMGSNWDEEITVLQLFTISNTGKIDSTIYTLKYEVGPPSNSRTFYLNSTKYLVRTSVHFRSNNGSSLDYYIPYNGSNQFTLPDYPDGYWQIGFEYYINGKNKFYVSQKIDYDNSSDELQIILQFDAINTVSIIEMDKNLIIGANRLEVQGYDSNGIYQYMTIPVVYDSNMLNRISFDLPIDPSCVYVCGENFCHYYEAKIVSIKKGNISVFNLIQRW